jgi:hypothetical protein
MKLVEGFGRFWWDFIVGDDWKIAATVATVLVVGALAVAGQTVGGTWVAPIFGAVLALAFAVGLAVDVRRRSTGRAR